MDLSNGLVISSSRHPSIRQMGKYFAYGHLPPKLQAISVEFALIGQFMVDYFKDCPELTETLRKLWEAKNQAVLAAGFLDLAADRQEKIDRGDAVNEDGRTVHA